MVKKIRCHIFLLYRRYCEEEIQLSSFNGTVIVVTQLGLIQVLHLHEIVATNNIKHNHENIHGYGGIQ